ncbi:MAG: hypothetical protein JNM76_02090 [Betaproteobacteria bacterium]|nr:hypothetical protein [Betaproteobacteria bacterium]
MNRKPIFLTQLNNPTVAHDPAPDEHASLRRAFESLVGALHAAYRQRHGGAATPDDCIALSALLEEFLTFIAQSDAEHGADAPLPLADGDIACADALRACAALEGWLNRLDLAACQNDLDTVILGISLWAMRHDCALRVPEPMVNALARLANRAATRQDVAAAFALMQGAIEHLKPLLAADLEQSNPDRPWRVLHLNFAITGIRSGDGLLAGHAFSALNAGLPHEREGFYAEALHLARQSRLPDEMTALIQAQHEASVGRH